VRCFKSPQGFNTSYVSVQAKDPILVIFGRSRFNTSYVSVQGFFFMERLHFIIVSIHPMFRFKAAAHALRFSLGYVSIHPMFRFKNFSLEEYEPIDMFQYILCFGSSKYKLDPSKYEVVEFQYILCFGSSKNSS